MEPVVPVLLRRRFEALAAVLPVPAADLSELKAPVEALCEAGAALALVGLESVEQIDRSLRARPRGPGSLHLIGKRGSEVYEVGPEGPRFVWGRRATPAEEASLDRAARLLSEALAARGLKAEVQECRLNSRCLRFEAPAGPGSPPRRRPGAPTFEARLVEVGISGLEELVRRGEAAALAAGLVAPRVSMVEDHLEIGLTDESDAVGWFRSYLWEEGIGSSLLLVAADRLGLQGGLAARNWRLTTAAGAASLVSLARPVAGRPARTDASESGEVGLAAILLDQLGRRQDGEPPAVDDALGWCLSLDGVEPTLERAHESLFTLADGRQGTTGAPFWSHESFDPTVLIADRYTPGEAETELLQGPGWSQLETSMPPRGRLARRLDLHTGVLEQSLHLGHRFERVVQFASLEQPGKVALRAAGLSRGRQARPPLTPPRQGFQVGQGEEQGLTWMSVEAGTSEVAAVARDDHRDSEGRLDRVALYVDSRREVERTAAALRLGEDPFEGLLWRHRAAWARRWTEADIEVASDAELTLAIRFALFHMMASVADRGEAALGARGLSGTGYRGHVFWDSDVYVLPFLAATHPAAARAMLEYRVRRLPAARAAARRAGLEGAKFPWESAESGEDVTPKEAVDQYGRKLLILTGQMEEHIVADVAWAVRCYLDWSGDRAFAEGAGGEILVDTARYWASRIRLDAAGRGHIDRVIGPDEYHEGVDDDAFTNVMARWNLRQGAQVAEAGRERAGDGEAARWRGLADRLVDGYDPATQIYEQFRGFHTLEPILIRDVAPRRPIAGDVLLGRERTNGAQVIKQASVLMLHHLVPEEVQAGSLAPNLDYYEPRTSHGSSLSPGIHAALMAREGRLEEAESWLRLAARIDLDDVTDTTAGGLHMASMGSVWQALVMGFAGIRPRVDALEICPRIPPTWGSLNLRLSYRGNRLRLEITPSSVRIDAEGALNVALCGGAPQPVPAGESRLPLGV